MKAGDIVGWSGRNATSGFINLVTRGLPIVSVSHIGIMANDEAGKLRHWESTTLTDLICAIQGRKVSGVQAVDLTDRLNTYDGRAWHYPLARSLYPDESQRLTTWLMQQLGKTYDTPNAIRAGGIFGILTAVAHWRRMRHYKRRQRAYFCSELVAGAACDVGPWTTDDPEKWSPTRLVRHLRRREFILPGRRIL